MKKYILITAFLFLYPFPLVAQPVSKGAAAARAAAQAASAAAAEKTVSTLAEKSLLKPSFAATAGIPARVSEQIAFYNQLERHIRQIAPLPTAERIYNSQTREALLKLFPAPQPPYQLEDWERFSQQDVAEYMKLYKDIRAFHRYLLQKLWPLLSNFRREKIAPEEKTLIADQIAILKNRIYKQLSKMNSLDPAFERMLTDMDLAREVLFDLKGQLVRHQAVHEKPFDEKEFRLFPPEGIAPRFAVRQDENIFSTQQSLQTAKQLCLQLPSNLHVAVLNDDPANARQYARWENAGAFSNGITFTHFSSVNQFLEFIKEKQRFDIILTDFYIPGGGGDFLVKFLREQKDTTPVLFHSYAGGNTVAWQTPRQNAFLYRLYDTGYDGYLPSNDDFFTDRGYLYVLEGLRNFHLAHPTQD